MDSFTHFVTRLVEGPLEYKFAWLLALSMPFALIKGRWVERFIVLGFMGAIYAAGLARGADLGPIGTIKAIAVVDVCLMAFTIPFALWSDRYWPMWLLGCWIMMVLVDIVILMQPKPNIFAFADSSAVWSDAAMIIIWVGTYMEGMRRPKTKLPRLQLVFGNER